MMQLVDPQNTEQLEAFDAFICGHPMGSFMQHSAWAEVKNNWQVDRVISVGDTGEIRGAMQILSVPKPGEAVHFLYAPRGPVCDFDDMATLTDLLEGAKAVQHKRNGYLLRIDPYIEADQNEWIDNLTQLGFCYTPGQKIHQSTQPRFNYMLEDLKGQTPDELFMKIGRKSRYCIRFAQRYDLEICQTGVEGLDDFYSLYATTGSRKGFALRPKDYLKRLLQAFGDQARLYLCYYEGKPICGGIATNVAGKVSYVYGASDNQHRELNATYLLQWQMMQWALETGCDIYDFQGVVLTPEEDEALYGVYLFKQSFKSGRAVEFAGDFDLIYDPAAYARLEQ